MALLREIAFANQAVYNLIGLRRDMRFNAQVYKSSLLNRKARADVLSILKKDVAAYNGRIKWMTDITGDVGRNAALKSGIEALGVTRAGEVIDEYVELQNANSNLARATVDTIEAAADQLLLDLPAYDTVFR